MQYSLVGHFTGLGTRTKQLGRAVAGRPGGRDGEGSSGEGRGGEGSSEGGKGGAKGSNSRGHFGCLEEWGVRKDVKKKDRGVGLNVRDVIGRQTQKSRVQPWCKQVIPRGASNVAPYKMGNSPPRLGIARVS